MSRANKGASRGEIQARGKMWIFTALAQVSLLSAFTLTLGATQWDGWPAILAAGGAGVASVAVIDFILSAVKWQYVALMFDVKRVQDSRDA